MLTKTGFGCRNLNNLYHEQCRPTTTTASTPLLSWTLALLECAEKWDDWSPANEFGEVAWCYVMQCSLVITFAPLLPLNILLELDSVNHCQAVPIEPNMPLPVFQHVAEIGSMFKLVDFGFLAAKPCWKRCPTLTSESTWAMCRGLCMRLCACLCSAHATHLHAIALKKIHLNSPEASLLQLFMFWHFLFEIHVRLAQVQPSSLKLEG